MFPLRVEGKRGLEKVCIANTFSGPSSLRGKVDRYRLGVITFIDNAIYAFVAALLANLAALLAAEWFGANKDKAHHWNR